MLAKSLLIAAAGAVVPALAAVPVPSLNVPACPSLATIRYDKSVPDKKPFPLTTVDLCYEQKVIQLYFTAYNETNYFFNPNYTTNDAIYNYEVMEAFIYQGTKDPQTYFEFEVAPNNVTFNSFIYNPSKVRATGAPFDGGLIRMPIVDGITAKTVLDRKKHTWVSEARIPLGLFNVDDGQAKGTQWRMNFFRTVVSPSAPSNQTLGAWNPPNAPNFHESPYFGRISFV